MNNRGGRVASLFLLCVAAGASGCTASSPRSGTGEPDAAADGTTGDGAPGTLDAETSDGGVGAPVGSPCTPQQERDPSFSEFSFSDVALDPNPQCESNLCLLNHFQGRVSCPYGQDADGGPLPGTVSCTSTGESGCCTPVTGLPVTGVTGVPGVGPAVSPQCLNRTSNETVYCSCQCAIPGSDTGDAGYCACPSGFSCTPLVSSLGADGGVAAYCVKNGTQFDLDADGGPCNGTCDPDLKNCGDAQGVH